MSEVRDRWPSIVRRCVPLLSIAALSAAAHAQPANVKHLEPDLRLGGYVILMRHASSPRTPPDASQMASDNVEHERELDDVGRANARSMGEALRSLKIPIGRVMSSATYRAIETVRLTQLGVPSTFAELGDAGQSMQSDQSGRRGAWIRAQVAQSPAPGTNTLMVTHYPNIAEAFPDDAKGLEDGEALIFHPDGHGQASLVARVKITQWAQWAASP